MAQGGSNKTVSVILVDGSPGNAELQLGLLRQQPSWSSAFPGQPAMSFFNLL
jgi:hypothetical protein